MPQPWTQLPAAYVDSLTIALESEAIRYVPREQIEAGTVTLIVVAVLAGLVCLWPLFRDVCSAAWLLYREWRASRKRNGEVERAREGGM